MIENLDFLAPDEKVMEGTFKSKIFKNECDNKLFVYLRDDTIKDYAEKCIEHFNSLSDHMVDLICENLIKSCENDCPDADYELPELENVKDILNYCWFTSITVDIPQTDEPAYNVEGEGEWGECVGFIIRGNKLLYVGINFEDSPWENDEYYKDLYSNCLNL